MSFHKVEHLEVSHKIGVCFCKGGDQLVKAAQCLFSVATDNVWCASVLTLYERKINQIKERRSGDISCLCVYQNCGGSQIMQFSGKRFTTSVLYTDQQNTEKQTIFVCLYKNHTFGCGNPLLVSSFSSERFQ